MNTCLQNPPVVKVGSIKDKNKELLKTKNEELLKTKNDEET